MLTFLFWNVGGELPKVTSASKVVARNTRLREIIGNLARAHDIDLLVLAECPIGSNDLLQRLNVGTAQRYMRVR